MKTTSIPGDFVNAMIAFNNMINSEDGWISHDQYATFDASTETEIANYDFLSLGILS